MNCETADVLLDAALDNELDPLQSTQLDAHLLACAACTARLENARRLQQALRTQLPYHRAPASVLIPSAIGPARRWKQLCAALAAALLLTAGLLAWTLSTRTHAASKETTLAEALESDHLRSLLTPDSLTAVLSSDQHTVKPWFIGKLPYTPPVFDLTAEGFPLVGGRLDVLEHEPIAALVYRHGNHFINLFVWPGDAGNSSITPVSTPRGYHLAHWTSGSMNFWAVTDMDPQQLAVFAERLRGHIH